MHVTTQKALTRFLENNEELVLEYNKIPGNSDIYFEISDILSKINNNTKILQHMTLSQLMKESISWAISQKTNILEGLSHIIVKDFDAENLIQKYFKEVGKIYEENNNEFDFDFCEENREKLIKMNLKSVISIAKQYRGMGIDMEDLISAGNLGLCRAWEKFKPLNGNLQDNILKEIDKYDETISGEDVISIIGKHVSYGRIFEKLNKRFSPIENYSTNDIQKWVLANIQPPKFSSVAAMWIKAFILNEIDQNSRTVKKPKVDIYKDKEKFGSYFKETTVDIDAPVAQNSNVTIGDAISNENTMLMDIDINESYNFYKQSMRKLLHGLSSRNRSILLKRFGIGLPRPMTPKEIAQQEGLTVARVCQIFQDALNETRKNAKELNIDPNELFEACSTFN